MLPSKFISICFDFFELNSVEMPHDFDAAVSTLCRTCLASCDLLPLFPFPSPDSTARARKQLELHRVTGLRIEVDDGLPQTICKKCEVLVNSAVRLRDQCLLAEQKLLDIGYKIKLEMFEDNQSSNSNSDANSFQYIDMDNNFDASSPMIPIFHCIKEDIEMKSLIVLPVSTDSYKETTEIPFRKETIISTSNNTRKIKEMKELKYIEKVKKCEEFSDGPLNINGPNRCKLCKRLCNSLTSFSFHLRIHIGFNHVCEFCGKKFYAAIGLKRHCMSWHGLEKELSCAHCHHRSTSISRLKEHERTHTGEKPFECAECGGRFHTRSSIIQHLRLHIAKKTVQCDKCPSMFKNRRALTTHINQSHVRDYLYLCYMCDKRYSKNTTARKHLSKFHGVPRAQQGKIPRFSLSKSAVVN